MELAAVLFLELGIIVSALAIVVLVPLSLGMMAWDIYESHKTAPKKVAVHAEDAGTSIALKRGVARGFVLAGAAFWSVATFIEMYSLRESGAGPSILAAFVPLGMSLATLVVGWYWERTTAATLLAASIGVVAWGVVYGFTAGVWALLTITLIGPMLTAAVLFWAARREQEAFEQATALRPQMAFVFAARSSIAG